MRDLVQRRQAANLEKCLADGPRLRYDYSTWVEARADGKVLLGGLGAMGLGSMWVTETERHRADPTYASAPYAPNSRDGFGETAAGAPPPRTHF